MTQITKREQSRENRGYIEAIKLNLKDYIDMPNNPSLNIPLEVKEEMRNIAQGLQNIMNKINDNDFSLNINEALMLAQVIELSMTGYNPPHLVKEHQLIYDRVSRDYSIEYVNDGFCKVTLVNKKGK